MPSLGLVFVAGVIGLVRPTFRAGNQERPAATLSSHDRRRKTRRAVSRSDVIVDAHLYVDDLAIHARTVRRRYRRLLDGADAGVLVFRRARMDI